MNSLHSIKMEQIRTGAYKIVDNLDTVPEPLILTDVNDDCKIKIFEHLIWSDLLSLCETSKQLRVASSDVFKRKYGNTTFWLKSDIRSIALQKLTFLLILREYKHITELLCI